MRLDATDVRPNDTLVYQPTAGSELRGEIVQVRDGQALTVRCEGRMRTLTHEALREADHDGRLRIEPAEGRVGEADPDDTPVCPVCGVQGVREVDDDVPGDLYCPECSLRFDVGALGLTIAGPDPEVTRR